MNRKALRALREEIGTRGVVAKLLGVSLRGLANWELGDSPAPRWVELALLELRRRQGAKKKP